MFDADAFGRAAFRVLFGICIIVTNSTANAESLSDRLNRSDYFAASAKNAAFPVRNSKGGLSLLLVDFETGTRKKLTIAKSHLLSPFLSPDGKRLLFVRHPNGQIGRELISCDTDDLACKSVLKSEGSISYPVEISGGRILYIASPYVIGADGKGRYHKKDFWLMDQSGPPRQLTSMMLYELSSISATENMVYFSALGPARDHPSIPPSDIFAKQRSDIFKLPFDSAQGKIEGPSQTLAPLFLANGYARSPSVSSDESLVAFLRTRTDIGNYRYELVISDKDGHATRLITSSGLGFSQPVVIGQSVYANEIYGDRYQIKNVSARPMKLVTEVTDESIDVLKDVELTVKP